MAVADDVAVRPPAVSPAQAAAGPISGLVTTSQPNGSTTNGQSAAAAAAPNGSHIGALTGGGPVELQRLRMMLLIRRFEERTYQEYTKPGQKIGGFCHLYSGQEAVAVGIAAIFKNPIDALINGYRCHGHSLALGMSPHVAMAELFGKATGCSKGKGGSMHLFDASVGNH